MSASTIDVTDASWDADVLQSDMPVFVDFWAPWCGLQRSSSPTSRSSPRSTRARSRWSSSTPRTTRNSPPRTALSRSPPSCSSRAVRSRRPSSAASRCRPSRPRSTRTWAGPTSASAQGSNDPAPGEWTGPAPGRPSGVARCRPSRVPSAPMRLVFLGSPPFATPILERLLSSERHEVLALVTPPDRPRGRGRAVVRSALAEMADQASIPVVQPASTKEPAFLEALAGFEPEVLMVASYGEILRTDVLELCPHGALNVHGSPPAPLARRESDPARHRRRRRRDRRQHPAHGPRPRRRRRPAGEAHRHRPRGDGRRPVRTAQPARRRRRRGGARPARRRRRRLHPPGRVPRHPRAEAHQGRRPHRLHASSGQSLATSAP